MSKTNNFVFKGLYIVAWLIFVGLSIEAGGLIVNFFFSLYKPDFLQHLYQKLDLTAMYEGSKFAFFATYSFIFDNFNFKGMHVLCRDHAHAQNGFT